MRRIPAALAALISFIFLLGSSAYAQETLGSINGTVKDSSGGVVAGASVKARSVATNLEQSTTTESDGSFAISDLPIGAYEVTVRATDSKQQSFLKSWLKAAAQRPSTPPYSQAKSLRK